MKGFTQALIGLAWMAGAVYLSPSGPFGFWHIITLSHMIIGFVIMITGIIKIR
jgi:ABC-type tungstate transport system substrate-binding protein